MVCVSNGISECFNSINFNSWLSNSSRLTTYYQKGFLKTKCSSLGTKKGEILALLLILLMAIPYRKQFFLCNKGNRKSHHCNAISANPEWDINIFKSIFERKLLFSHPFMGWYITEVFDGKATCILKCSSILLKPADV